MIDEIKQILASALGLGDRVNSFTEETQLLGSIPELDSMAVVSVIVAIEEHYDIVVEDDEISADTFETLGALTRFVESKVNS